MDTLYNKIGDAMFEIGRWGDGGLDAWGNVDVVAPISIDSVISRGGCMSSGTNARNLCSLY